MNLCKTLEGIKTVYVSQLIRYAESRQLQAVVAEVSTIAFEGRISQILWLIGYNDESNAVWHVSRQMLNSFYTLILTTDSSFHPIKTIGWGRVWPVNSICLILLGTSGPFHKVIRSIMLVRENLRFCSFSQKFLREYLRLKSVVILRQF